MTLNWIATNATEAELTDAVFGFLQDSDGYPLARVVTDAAGVVCLDVGPLTDSAAAAALIHIQEYVEARVYARHMQQFTATDF